VGICDKLDTGEYAAGTDAGLAGAAGAAGRGDGAAGAAGRGDMTAALAIGLSSNRSSWETLYGLAMGGRGCRTPVGGGGCLLSTRDALSREATRQAVSGGSGAT
jgi:hypothetical protein